MHNVSKQKTTQRKCDTPPSHLYHINISATHRVINTDTNTTSESPADGTMCEFNARGSPHQHSWLGVELEITACRCCKAGQADAVAPGTVLLSYQYRTGCTACSDLASL